MRRQQARACIFYVENAVCNDSYRRQCRRNRPLRSVKLLKPARVSFLCGECCPGGAAAGTMAGRPGGCHWVVMIRMMIRWHGGRPPPTRRYMAAGGWRNHGGRGGRLTTTQGDEGHRAGGQSTFDAWTAAGRDRVGGGGEHRPGRRDLGGRQLGLRLQQPAGRSCGHRLPDRIRVSCCLDLPLSGL